MQNHYRMSPVISGIPCIKVEFHRKHNAGVCENAFPIKLMIG